MDWTRLPSHLRHFVNRHGYDEGGDVSAAPTEHDPYQAIASDVHYDTGPQPGEATLSSYNPGFKEQIANYLMGDQRPSPERRQFAQGIADMASYAPGISHGMSAQNVGRALEAGDYGLAGASALGAIPAVGKYARNAALGLARRAFAEGGGAWTRKEGQNPDGGLNAKGRASAKAEGHNLKPPAPHPKTDKDAARRKSFCSRMKGMKSKLTSSETANDPDSRINKSLRAWNCHADGGAVWNRPRPKSLGKPKHLSSEKKAKAKAAAKAAGRPYPNLVDNMRAARSSGGGFEGDVQFAPEATAPIEAPQQSDSIVFEHPESHMQSLPMRPSYGPRYNPRTGDMDSPELKDIGFYGPLKTGERDIASEYTIGSKHGEIPSFAPGLSDQQLAALRMAARLHADVPEDIVKNAHRWAEQRHAEGKTPFFDQRYDEYPKWNPEQYWEKPKIYHGD